jgi:hypothetical protein
MPITPYLDGFDVNPETKLVLGLALETARIVLGVTNRGDLANKIIAKQIIELAKVGERNHDLLCEGALKKYNANITCTATNTAIIQAPPTRPPGTRSAARFFFEGRPRVRSDDGGQISP